jgi:two-component system phosphate regulon response regulator PhoB
MKKRVLVVDDEPDLLDLVAHHFRASGYAVDTAKSGSEGLHLASRNRPNVVILDLMLPDIQGTEILRRIRTDPETAGIPVVLLTARGEEVDRVVGFELGADDYVVKPFSPRELVLRVGALLRRAGEPADGAAVPVLEHAGIRLDAGRHEVSVDGRRIDLTPLEFKLLAYFLERPGRVLSRNDLLENVWGDAVYVTDRTVDTHIKRLRSKLDTGLIETVRGVGYRLRE